MCFFFFKQKTAYEIMPSLVGSEMCIREELGPELLGDPLLGVRDDESQLASPSGQLFGITRQPLGSDDHDGDDQQDEQLAPVDAEHGLSLPLATYCPPSHWSLRRARLGRPARRSPSGPSAGHCRPAPWPGSPRSARRGVSPVARRSRG